MFLVKIICFITLVGFAGYVVVELMPFFLNGLAIILGGIFLLFLLWVLLSWFF